MLRVIWYHRRKQGVDLPLGLVHAEPDLAETLIEEGYARCARTDHKVWPHIDESPPASDREPEPEPQEEPAQEPKPKRRRYARRDMKAVDE